MSAPPVEASEKLRLVLDYVPCERCLATPTLDQEILCSLCARIHRQVGVRIGTRTNVILERPSPPPAAPVVIEPPAPVPAVMPPVIPESPPAPRVEVIFDHERKRHGAAIEIIVDPLPEPEPVPVVPPVILPATVDTPPAVEEERIVLEAEPEPTPAPEPVPEPEAVEAEPEFEPDWAEPDVVETPVVVEDEDEETWEDVAWYEGDGESPAFEDSFSHTEPAREPRREPEPPEDDFVFRPPAEEEPVETVRTDDALDTWTPAEEIELEAEGESRWAPPPDHEFAPEPEPEPVEEDTRPWAPVEEEVVEFEAVGDEPEVEEDLPILVLDEGESDIVELEMVDEPETPVAPGPPPASDLYRLRGFNDTHYEALAPEGIEQLAHLSGHDPHELARRTSLAAEMLVPWVQVADLVTEVGVPVDAAVALVAAGVAGPRGLAESEPDDIVDRVSAFGGATLNLRDVKRWKRRA